MKPDSASQTRRDRCQEWYSGFQTVCHAQFVFDDEQSMQKSLRLEIQRVIDVVFGPVEPVLMIRKHIAKDVARPDVFDIFPDRRE